MSTTMLFVLLFSALAAVATFMMFRAIAELTRGNESDASALRDRFTQSFEGMAERRNQRQLRLGKATLAERLLRAGLKLRPAEFVAIQFGLAIVLGVLGLLRFGFGPAFLIMAVIGYLVPYVFLRLRQRRRLRAFSAQLPDTLSLLSNGLKAGFALPQAIDSVARNGVPPMSEEFARVVREMNLGSTVESALENMVRRVGSDDLDLVVTAILVQTVTGGNLAKILESISYTIRERVRVQGEISALTAQARASGTIITILPFVLMAVLFLITPGYFKPMLEKPLGWIMLGLAGISISFGAWIVRRLSAVEV
jgi:tight adherence protein B